MGEEVYIVSMGHQHPDNKLDNQFYESLNIGSSAQWVEERTGIRTRYSVLCQEQIRSLRNGHTSLANLREAGAYPGIADMVGDSWTLLKARDRSEKVTDSCAAVICGTSVPDQQIPAQASLIAKKIDLGGICLDVNTACSSFVINLQVANGLLKSGMEGSIAVFNPERYTVCLDFTDRRSCVLFGDGCAAALLRKGKGLRGFRIIDLISVSDPKGCDLVRIPLGGLFYQNGARVQRFAISRTCEVTERILGKNGVSVGDLSWFVGHQANLRMLSSVCQKLGIDGSKHLYNVDRFGNQGAAGAPAVLSDNWDRFENGDLVVVSVVGSGLTWGAALLEFSDY